MKAMTSRRAFLKGLSAASLFAGGGCASILSSRSPNSLLCHACVGTANMAKYDMEQFLANPRVKVTALCDLPRLEGASRVRRRQDRLAQRLDA